ncbi:MAG: hypothetical protein HKN35_02890 [Woeseia sp.]|nr:GspH/FimT family pseudopilin [Woeseia sp.]MBT8097105.1 GspH/FimT family pseudopilin [Woeseia sp.]NNE59819.1 hypothetical protein [Woeseia sp.]
MRRESGYTLFELLMTVALAALLLFVGVPSLGKIAADNELRAQIDPLFHAIHLARKESIMRREVITLCPSVDGELCSNGTDWSAGWQMFVNRDRDHPAQRDDGEIVLRRHAGNDRVRIVANRRSFTLRATQRRATNGTFIFCDRGGRISSRALIVSYTGRPRVARQTRDGETYRCKD